MRRTNTYLILLMSLEHDRDRTSGRSEISAYEHSLQTAARARRDGADDEMIAVALLHDVLRNVAVTEHGPALALALSDRLTPARMEILRTHSDFQHDAIHGTDYAARLHGDEHWFTEAVRLALWDSMAFDPDYPTPPLEEFTYYVARLMGEMEHAR